MIAKVYAIDKNGKKFNWRISYDSVAFTLSRSLERPLEINLPKHKAPWIFKIVSQSCENLFEHGETILYGEVSKRGYISVVFAGSEDSSKRARFEEYKKEFNKRRKNKPAKIKKVEVKREVRVDVQTKKVHSPRHSTLRGHHYYFSVKSVDQIDYKRIVRENRNAVSIAVFSKDWSKVIDSDILALLREDEKLPISE